MFLDLIAEAEIKNFDISEEWIQSELMNRINQIQEQRKDLSLDTASTIDLISKAKEE